MAEPGLKPRGRVYSTTKTWNRTLNKQHLRKQDLYIITDWKRRNSQSHTEPKMTVSMPLQANKTENCNFNHSCPVGKINSTEQNTHSALNRYTRMVLVSENVFLGPIMSTLSLYTSPSSRHTLKCLICLKYILGSWARYTF